MSQKKNIPWDRIDLHHLYWDEGLTMKEIASKFGVNTEVVRRIMVKKGIPRRTKSEIAKARVQEGKLPPACARGEASPSWKGGRIYETRRGERTGYVLCYAPGHPRAQGKRYVYEHILVWERTHNRRLPEGYVIHHINGIKDDNRPRNLVALPRGKHHSGLMVNALKQRIRELEAEVKLLEKALDQNQMIFRFEEN